MYGDLTRYALSCSAVTNCLISASNLGMRCRASSCMLGVFLRRASSRWSASKRWRLAATSAASAVAGTYGRV